MRLDWFLRALFVGLTALSAVPVGARQRPAPGTPTRITLSLRETPRVLFKTGGWPDSSRFPERIPVMAADVPAFLAGQGVALVGVDVPSVDPIESAELEIHHVLGRHGIGILESLDLEAVPEGVYELIALPLRLAGADGSPVRAVLLSRE